MSKKSNIHLKALSALIILTININVAIAIDSIKQEEISQENDEVFSDISIGNRNYVAIKYLKQQNIIEGYEDGSFKPLNEINRAEALKILYETFDINLSEESEQQKTSQSKNEQPETSQSKNEQQKTFQSKNDQQATYQQKEIFFADVPENAWFYNYISDASKRKIVEGYPDGLFHPENTINRAETLKIALLLEGEFIPENITEKPYTDVPTDIWFAKYAYISNERSLISKSRADGSLLPSQNMNRGDFADLVYRIIKSKEGNRFAGTTWYGFEDVNWGTASGEKFDTNLPKGAHKTLPFGTKILVTNLSNGKQVIIEINDRGPYSNGLDLDLTSSAFESIASLKTGVIYTEYEIISEQNNENIKHEKTNQIDYGF